MNEISGLKISNKLINSNPITNIILSASFLVGLLWHLAMNEY